MTNNKCYSQKNYCSKCCCCQCCCIVIRGPTGPTGPDGPNYSFNVAITDGPRGRVLKGPFSVTNGKLLSFTSKTLDLAAQRGPAVGSASVQVEQVRPIIGPIGPTGQTGPTGSYNGTLGYANWAGANTNLIPGLANGASLPPGWPNLPNGPNTWYEISPLFPGKINNVSLVITNNDTINSHPVAVANVNFSTLPHISLTIGNGSSPPNLFPTPLVTNPATIIIPANTTQIVTFTYQAYYLGPQVVMFYCNDGSNSLYLNSLRGI